MRRRLRVNTAVSGLAVLMLSGALSAGSPAGALADAGSPGTGSQVCQSVIVKVRATHWVWLKETRKIHGRRVFVRRHGKILRRHVRVSYFRLEPERLCTVTTLAALTPPSPVAPAAPAPVTPAPPQVLAPANTGSPTISGTARAGQTLTRDWAHGQIRPRAMPISGCGATRRERAAPGSPGLRLRLTASSKPTSETR